MKVRSADSATPMALRVSAGRLLVGRGTFRWAAAGLESGRRVANRDGRRSTIDGAYRTWCRRHNEAISLPGQPQCCSNSLTLELVPEMRDVSSGRCHRGRQAAVGAQYSRNWEMARLSFERAMDAEGRIEWAPGLAPSAHAACGRTAGASGPTRSRAVQVRIASLQAVWTPSTGSASGNGDILFPAASIFDWTGWTAWTLPHRVALQGGHAPPPPWTTWTISAVPCRDADAACTPSPPAVVLSPSTSCLIAEHQDQVLGKSFPNQAPGARSPRAREGITS